MCGTNRLTLTLRLKATMTGIPKRTNVAIRCRVEIDVVVDIYLVRAFATINFEIHQALLFPLLLQKRMRLTSLLLAQRSS